MKTHIIRAILATLIAIILLTYAFTTPGNQLLAALIGGMSGGFAIEQTFKIFG
jgi:hypothetical protein